MPASRSATPSARPEDFALLLSGGDLRSLGRLETALASVQDQAAFDALFACLVHKDRRVAMRAADGVEKLTRKRPEWLRKHGAQVLSLAKTAEDKELIWHLAQLLPRLPLEGAPADQARKRLKAWALDPEASRIVRVNALQALHDLACAPGAPTAARQAFAAVASVVEKESVSSLRARLRKLGNPGT